MSVVIVSPKCLLLVMLPSSSSPPSLLLSFPLSLGYAYWVRGNRARGARRTVPFYDRRIAVEHCGVVVAGHFEVIGVVFGAVEACSLACR
jgi:hypothetical protein